MKLKAAIFDLDDTLYTSWDEADHAAYLAIGAKAQELCGIPDAVFIEKFHEMRLQMFCELGGIGSAHNRGLYAQRALEALGINPIPYTAALFDAYWDAILDTMVLCPEVPGLFDSLRAAGIRIGICTNMTAEIQMRKLRYLGLDRKIDCFVSSEEAGADKPAPAPFHLALRKAAAGPSEAIFIGDNFGHDVLGAASVGMRSIWLNWKGKPSHPEQVSHWEVRSMAEAAALLRKMQDSSPL